MMKWIALVVDCVVIPILLGITLNDCLRDDGFHLDIMLKSESFQWIVIILLVTLVYMLMRSEYIKKEDTEFNNKVKQKLMESYSNSLINYDKKMESTRTLNELNQLAKGKKKIEKDIDKLRKG